MQSINKYFNEKETELLKGFEDQMLSIHNNRKNLKRQMDKNQLITNLKHVKYLNNLKRQTRELKEIIEHLKMVKISELIFFEKKFINEQNINSLNRDVLQVIQDLDFGGTQYLFVQNNWKTYKITTDIEEVKTLMKENEVGKIYKGEYNETMSIKEMVKKCELIFNRRTMTFKKTNICDIRKSNEPIYDLRITLARDMGRTFENFDESYLIRDMCDFDIIEENILQRGLSVVRASVDSIDDVNDDFINVAPCFSIEKRQLYNKCNLNFSNRHYKLYNRVEQLINKAKQQEIDWNDCLDFSDVEMEY